MCGIACSINWDGRDITTAVVWCPAIRQPIVHRRANASTPAFPTRTPFWLKSPRGSKPQQRKHKGRLAIDR